MNIYFENRQKSKKRNEAIFTGNTLEKTEFTIIGGGITGLLAAYFLTKENKTVSLFEKGEINDKTKFYLPEILSYDAERSLSGLKSEFGSLPALDFYNLSFESLSEIKSILHDIKIEKVEEKDSFVFSDGTVSEDDLNEEYRLRRFGGFDVEMITKTDAVNLFSFPTEGGIYTSKGGLYVNKKEFSEKMTAYLSLKGVLIYENSEITYVTENENGGFFVEDKNKNTVFSDFVFDCRGVSLLSRYPLSGKRKATFFIKSFPVSNFNGWHNKAFLRDIYESPFYFIPTDKNEVLLCGLDFSSPKKRESIYGMIFEKIKEKRVKILKDTAEEAFFSLGKIDWKEADFSEYLQTKDRLPRVGKDGVRKNYFYIIPGSKNEILSGFLAAKCAVFGAVGKNTDRFDLIKRNFEDIVTS